jgi:hypothetical protein
MGSSAPEVVRKSNNDWRNGESLEMTNLLSGQWFTEFSTIGGVIMGWRWSSYHVDTGSWIGEILLLLAANQIGKSPQKVRRGVRGLSPLRTNWLA